MALIYLPPNSSLEDAVERLVAQKELLGCKLSRTQARTTLKYFQGDELASTVFLKKYALRDLEGNLLELTLSDSRKRWATAIQEVDPGFIPQELRLLFRHFFPGGRQMLILGNPYVKGTPFNCYTNEIEEDSLEGIFKAGYEIAKTFAWGGGQGICLGKLRPRRSLVSNTARHSTGAISFGELYSYITGTIGQDGRRGALMLSLPIHHPDIEEFIEIKHGNTDKLRYVNTSIKVSDEFLQAVQEQKQFRLHFETSHETIEKWVDAQQLWQKILQAARDSAEPGILFWDRYTQESPSDNYEQLKLVGTNACSELGLEDKGACCIGAFCLDRFIDKPFTKNASFNFDLFKECVRLGVRYLDDVVEIGLKKHPLPKQTEIAALSRRIGQGITGVGDMFLSLGLDYGSPESLVLLEEIQKTKCYEEHRASIHLAEERGSFPLFNPEIHYSRGVPSRLLEDIIQEGKQKGQRNVTLSTIAPSGSVAILAQASSGIEPIYSKSFTRIVELGGQRTPFLTIHPGISRLMATQNIPLDEVKVQTAYEVSPERRVALQSLCQKYVDSAISSTVNLPTTATVDQIRGIYELAWKSGCKGITVYRQGSREDIYSTGTKGPSPDTVVHKFSAEGGDKFYLHISYKDGNLSQPYQAFVTNYKAVENDRFIKVANALHRMLVGKVDDKKIAQQLARSTSSLIKLTRLLSLGLKNNLLDDILKILDEFGYAGSLAAKLKIILQSSSSTYQLTCPECKSTNVKVENGCMCCNDCGSSRCS